ncbi:MAG: hypothetical protein QXO40_04770 [Candidatus Aenigmatarchaeota archaeon]
MQVNEIIEKVYGLNLDKFEIIKQKNDKVRILTKDAFHVMNAINIKVKYYGLYLGKIKRNNKFIFSLDATSLFGKNIKKNVVELNEEDIKKWLSGNEIEKNLNMNENFVVVKFKEYYLGSGYYKNGKILNFFPTKRLKQYLNYV